VLELGAVGACFLGQGHEVLGPLKVTVMVRGDIRDEVGGLVRADEAIADAEGRHRFIVRAVQPGWWAGGSGPPGLSFRGLGRCHMGRIGPILITGLCCGVVLLAGCSSETASSDAAAPASASEPTGVPDTASSPAGSSSPAEATMEDLEAIGDIEVDNGLLTVTVTLPADLVEGATQADIDKDIDDGEILDGSLNEDGSVTYVMSSAQHNAILDEMREGFDEIVAEEEKTNPGLYEEVTFNDDMGEFEVVVASEQKYRDSMSMMGLGLQFGASFFQIFYGVPEEDRHVVITYIDSQTGDVIDTYDSREESS